MIRINVENVAILIGCMLPALIAAYTDARQQMVYDKVTLPVMLSGLVSAVYTQRLPEALLGMAFAGGLLLAGAALGGVGGGDVKLVAGLGLWFGFSAISEILLIASLLGLAWGMAKLVRAGELKGRVRAFSGGLYLRICGVRGAVTLPRLPESSGTAVPFGTCLALASWAAYLWRW
jgi:prepilin signal peptidase PulO-like enzyme (type II secretory pathway)